MIIPTVFVKKGENFKERFDKVVAVSNNVQIDFMDGYFVKGKSVQIEEIPDLITYPNHTFEAHLMVDHPQGWVEGLNLKGFKKVIFHYEALPNLPQIQFIIGEIKRLGMEAMIAINPKTDVEELEFLDEEIDKVLVMGIEPGQEKQKFIEKTYEKVMELKKRNFEVQVDGGITPEIAERLAEIGCDAVNSGSYISGNENPEHAFHELDHVFDRGRVKYLQLHHD